MKQLPKLELEITEESQDAETVRKTYEEFEKQCFKRLIQETSDLFQDVDKLVQAIQQRIDSIHQTLDKTD